MPRDYSVSSQGGSSTSPINPENTDPDTHQFSFFENNRSGSGGKRDFSKLAGSRTIGQVLDLIRGDELLEYTQKARPLHAAAVASGPKSAKTQQWLDYADHKETASAVTWGAKFQKRRYKERGNGRRQDNWIHHGYVLCESDEQSPDLVKDALADDDAVMAIYSSSSGAGAHVVWRVDPVPTSNDEHHAAWIACSARMKAQGIDSDSGAKDVTRLSFLSRDTAPHYRPLGGRVSWEMPAQKPQEASKARTRAASAGPGSKDHATLDRQAAGHVGCPRKSGDGGAYNRWLALVRVLRSLRFSEIEIADWCASGNAGSCGDLAELATHTTPDLDPEDQARRVLWGMAGKAGWKKPWGGARPGPGRPEEPGSERSAHRGRESLASLDNFSASRLIERIPDNPAYQEAQSGGQNDEADLEVWPETPILPKLSFS